MPHTTSDIEKQFDAFVASLVATGVAAPTDLKGCSDADITLLERKYGVKLPASYRAYLKRMGRGAGRLFTHDHVSASYEDDLGLTEYERQRRRRPEPDRPAARPVELPADALIILDRLGEQHLFVRCGRHQD